jgi:hypothetical protein
MKLRIFSFLKCSWLLVQLDKMRVTGQLLKILLSRGVSIIKEDLGDLLGTEDSVTCETTSIA